MRASDEAGEERVIPEGLCKNAVVAASVGAGAIHLWAAWAHWDFTRELLFFVLVGALQLWLAAVFLWVRSVPWSLLIGAAAANAAVVVVWVLTRTTGLPGLPRATHMDMDKIIDRAMKSPGPSKGFMIHKETFGLVDTTCSLLEVAVVVGVVLLLIRMTRKEMNHATAQTIAAASGGPTPHFGNRHGPRHQSLPR